MATRSSVYVDVNTLHVGIGTSAPSHQLHVRGDARITGTIYDVNNQHQWIPGSTIEWKPTTSPPALTLPTGGAFTSLTATALYRYFGTDISYSPTISGTITAQPTNTAQNFLLSVPYPANSNIYTTQTIVGELWLNVQSGLSSNTFKSYAQLIPGNYSNVTLRALTGTTDESLSTILAGSRITLQGNITYAAQYINNMNAIPSSYVPAIFAQDQVGKVALNTGGNPPRAQLDIITNSNTPTLVVDQQGTGNIAEFLDAGVQKVVIDGNGNVGIGTTITLRNVHVYSTDPRPLYLQTNTTQSGILLGGVSNEYTQVINDNNNFMQRFRINRYDGANFFEVLTANQSGTTGVLTLCPNNGNVGIGITNPSQVLDIQGNLSLTGTVRSANSPGFFAYHTGLNTDYTLPSFTNFPPSGSVATNYNIGNYFNTSTRVFTVPITGRYLIWCHFFSNEAVTTTNRRIFIFKNGNAIAQTGNYTGMCSGYSIIADLSINDTITLGANNYNITYFAAGTTNGWGVQWIG